ncbi:MAG: F0F1 ATP synthase subunit B [Acidimicrobiales bacterium]
MGAWLLALIAVLGVGGTASAQEEGDEPTASEEEIVHEAELLAEENGGTEEDGHCIETLVQGGNVDDCQEAPSPILPPTNELIWGSISFVALFLLLWKFAYPGIKKGMEGRTERIRTDLETAEGAKNEAERVLSDYRAQLADAKSDAGRIIEEARQQADALKRDQEQRLQGELAALRERAASDIESAKSQAIADLHNEVANLAIGAAEVVVQRNLDRQTQTELVEQYISQVASQGNGSN